jgi:hypothetical protein
MPVFGHSDNHAGLQMADMVCSAFLAPIACAVYGGPYAKWNRHCNSGYLDIRERFGQRLAARTFTWKDYHDQTCASLVVSNPVSKRGVGLMWGVTVRLRGTRRGRTVYARRWRRCWLSWTPSHCLRGCGWSSRWRRARGRLSVASAISRRCVRWSSHGGPRRGRGALRRWP